MNKKLNGNFPWIYGNGSKTEDDDSKALATNSEACVAMAAEKPKP